MTAGIKTAQRSTTNMNDPKRLQDLISSNALIDAFMGDSNPSLFTTSPTQQEDPQQSQVAYDDDQPPQHEKQEKPLRVKNHKNARSASMTNHNDDGYMGNKSSNLQEDDELQREEEALQMILDSISSSHDIEGLIDGIGSDLEYFLDHSSLHDLKMMNDIIDGVNASTNSIRGGIIASVDEQMTGDLGETHTENATTKNTSVDDQPFSNMESMPTMTPSPEDAPLLQPPISTTTIPKQFKTLESRISRVKTLLYNNDTIPTTTKTKTQHRSTTSSFIQHFLPMISSRNDHQNNNPPSSIQPTSSYNAINSTNHNYASTTNQNNSNNHYSNNPQYYDTVENSKIVLDTILKNKRNKDLIIPTLLQHLHNLPFEVRKDVASIFNYLLVNSDCSVRIDFVLYVQEYFDCILDFILDGHFVMNESTNHNSSIKEGENGNSTDNKEGVLSGHASTNNEEDLSNYPSPSPSSSTNAPPTQIKTPDVALHCGSMLRSIMRHPVLYAQLVNDEKNVQKYIFPFLDALVNQPTFEIASDALETLRLILHPMDMEMVIPNNNTDSTAGNALNPESTAMSSASATDPRRDECNENDSTSVLLKLKDPAEIDVIMEKISSSFLERDYTPIFIQRFNPKLLSSDHANYITRRICLQLLSSILLTRSNYNIMIKYVSSKSNLRTIMMLLRDSSAHITFEAFNVFKIFVANPNKPPEVVRILADNKVKLIKYLTGLHREREEVDEQFRDEKILVITTLEQLE